MFAGVPLTFSLDLVSGAVDQQMERILANYDRNIDRQGFLLTAQCAEIRDGPRKFDGALRTFKKTRRLLQGKTEQEFFSIRQVLIAASL